MNDLKLPRTRQLFQQKAECGEFESYALYVKAGAHECTFFSGNVDQDTYFDIASCGKILVTTPLILKTIANGKLRLGSTLDEFFEKVPEDKKNITIQQLLTHTSGIIRHPYTYTEHDLVAKEILSRPLKFKPGNDYAYSCSGMVLLGFVLEKIYEDSLEDIFESKLKREIGYTRSKFNISAGEENAAICYHSENVDGLSSPWDDENIRVLQTSAGSGGQFFTLADIKKFTKAVMEKDEKLYPKDIYDLAEKKYTPDCASESRGLGWLYVDEKFSQTGKLFPTGSFGHCGHTGQSIFFNREKNLCVVILSNATRCLNKRAGFKGYDYRVIMKLREGLHNEIYADLTELDL